MKSKLYFIIFMLLPVLVKSATTDFTISDITPIAYTVPGTPKFKITIRCITNDAPGPPFDADIYWKLDNGVVNKVNKTFGDVDWMGHQHGSIDDPLFKLGLTTVGKHKLKAWIKVTTPADGNAANDTFTMDINVISSLPKKNVVMEVFKHQYCPPCYGANVFNDTAAVSRNPNYIIAALYTVTGEDLYNADAKVVNTQYTCPHPTAAFDRYFFPYHYLFPDYYVPNQAGRTHLPMYGEREKFYEPVQVGLKNVSYNKTTRELKVTVDALFYDDLNGDNRFNLYLLEDGIKGYQADAPDPDNYIHNHVLRTMLGGAWGKAGSLPASIKKNDTKTCDFVYTLPADYNINNITVVGMVQTYNADSSKRRILNAEYNKLKQLLSVNNTQLTPTDIQVYPNPAKDNVMVRINGNSRDYELSIADISGRIYKTIHSNGNTEIDLHTLTPGNYFLYIDDGQVVHTKKIVKE